MTMPACLKYIVDEQGRKTSVLVPVERWESLNNDFQQLKQKSQVYTSIQNGVSEIAEARRKGKKLQTLKAFLKWM